MLAEGVFALPAASPPSSSAGLLRPRLMAAFHRVATPHGRRAAPLTLVVAPAGCGKTTLLAQYAETFDGPVGWLRIEPMDAAPDRLRARVLAALPGAGMPGLMVVDDLHFLEGSAAEAVLDRLLVAAPPGLHVIAASRRMPNLNLCRHELAEVAIVDAEQLRFRAWEVDRLLREVYREPLPADEVAALSRRVAGWAAGLQLFHLSTRGRPLHERRRAVAALDGRSKLSRAYLTRTVLADLPQQLRRFLVRTCVFDTLTADRCDGLLTSTNSQSQLERLERLQAFTETHDSGRTFHYHEVLRAHLFATLAEDLGEPGARAWHARAAAIVADEGAAVEAARAYARAEDWSAVRRLLGEIGATVAAEGLEPWRDLLPTWLVAEDPWLVLAEGRHRIAHGQLEAAISAFQRAETMFTSEPGRARCRSARLAASTWLPGGPGARTQWGGWLRATTRRHPGVVAVESEALDDPAGPLIAAVGYLLAGSIVDAERALALAGDEDRSATGLGARLLRAGWAVATGDPNGHARLAELAADAERGYLPWLARIARAAAALDRTETGLKEARTVTEECDRLGDSWGAAIADGLVQLGRSLSGQPDPDEATGLVTRVRALDAGVLVAWAQALLAHASVRTGIPEAELEVRRADGLARSAGVPGARVLALVAAAMGQRGRPDHRLAPVHAAAVHAGLPRALVTAWAGGGQGGSALSVPGTDAPVSLWCFGSFRLCVDGQPLDWSTIRPRARALVRILAMNAGRPVHRDTLVAALWPEATPAAATRCLHVALSSLRCFLETNVPAVGSRLLRRDGDAYLLALPADGYADVATFRAALQATRGARTGCPDEYLEALRTAVTAYGGELLPEDGAAEWVVSERDALRRHAADAAATLAAAELTGRPTPARAVAAAQRSVDIDPCHDIGWRLLITAHRRAGNLAAAERARREYADVLVSLGLDPASADVVDVVEVADAYDAYDAHDSRARPDVPVRSGRRTPAPR
jgi:DNA-binding SARP family transcriptional activator